MSHCQQAILVPQVFVCISRNFRPSNLPHPHSRRKVNVAITVIIFRRVARQVQNWSCMFGITGLQWPRARVMYHQCGIDRLGSQCSWMGSLRLSVPVTVVPPPAWSFSQELHLGLRLVTRTPRMPLTGPRPGPGVTSQCQQRPGVFRVSTLQLEAAAGQVPSSPAVAAGRTVGRGSPGHGLSPASAVAGCPGQPL